MAKRLALDLGSCDGFLHVFALLLHHQLESCQPDFSLRLRMFHGAEVVNGTRGVLDLALQDFPLLAKEAHLLLVFVIVCLNIVV